MVNKGPVSISTHEIITNLFYNTLNKIRCRHCRHLHLHRRHHRHLTSIFNGNIGWMGLLDTKFPLIFKTEQFGHHVYTQTKTRT